MLFPEQIWLTPPTTVVVHSPPPSQCWSSSSHCSSSSQLHPSQSAFPPSTNLPNPHVLPATTHATLTTLPQEDRHDHILTTSLTRSSTLVFRNIPSGKPESYILDIRSAGFVFAPYRVDVAADGSILGIWETFRGNPWDNRGAEKYVVDVANKRTTNVVVEAKVLGRKGFYEERAKCEFMRDWKTEYSSFPPPPGREVSPLSLVKNPMILLAIVALVFTLGMPKLMENMDPEMRAEFEEQQRSSPISGASSAMAGGGFDLAGWMAGTTSKPSPAANAEGSGAGAGAGATGRESGGSARRRA
ncbi:hypothetical protein N7481_000521 [Penicillium waksmanii]|uniref:uncharacterized protein n=1 Tax=Penicillium waksmanii TaxID=69791 RepID=UPI002547F7E9|nr:uncharacterized protein N7481_000521 [Penicillium waksmanii]KAJ6000112.1 hypothetical protein N7481_000521 [Penicillium waksmanii]